MKLLISLLMLLPTVALAQWKPERPVELIVGAAPAGANDRIGRTLQRLMQESKTHPTGTINVVNKPGEIGRAHV